MLLLKSLLLFCAAASVEGQRNRGSSDQSVLGGNDQKTDIPVTIGVRTDARVFHLADLAIYEISASTSAVSKDLAVSQLDNVTNTLQDLFASLSAAQDSTEAEREKAAIQRWHSTITIARKSPAKDDVNDMWTGKDEMDPAKSTPALESEPGYRAERGFTVHFQQLELASDFVSTLTSMPNVTIGWVEWKLSESTKSSLMSEFRAAAMKSLYQAGKDYAEILGLQLGYVTEINEEYVYENQMRWNRGYDRWDDNDSNYDHPSEVELGGDVSGKFIMRKV